MYSKYIYPIDDYYSGQYVVVTFEADDDYHYLSILLSSYKEKGYYMREIEYNKEHVIKNIDNYEPDFQFWLKAKNKDNEFIRIKLHKDNSDLASEIMIQLGGLRVSPYQMKDKSDIIDQRMFTTYDSNKTDGDYIQYFYTYSKLKKEVKYLYLLVASQYNLKYFSIGVGNNISNNSGYLKLIPLKFVYLTLLLWLL